MYAQDRLGIIFKAFRDPRKLGKGTVSVRLVREEELVKFVGWLPKPNKSR